MANVDPFVIKWPAKWVEDPELRDVLFYLNKFLHDLWKRTGGGDDFIEDMQNTENIQNFIANTETSYGDSFLSQIQDSIPSVSTSPVVFHSAIKTSNYTAVAGDFVEAQKGAIITLDPEADIDDEIMIANGDGTRITVSGAIKYTRLDSKLFIRKQGTSLHFQMFVDGTTKYWRIR